MSDETPEQWAERIYNAAVRAGRGTNLVTAGERRDILADLAEAKRNADLVLAKRAADKESEEHT